jgi:ferredoxin
MKTPATSPRERGTHPGSAPRLPNAEVPMSGLALGIDRITCDGYGSCAELLPEMIALDDWGYPILRPGPVPTDLLGHARMAVDTCPVLALRLVAVARATMAPALNTPAANNAPAANAPAAAVRAGGPARPLADPVIGRGG